MCGRFTQRLSWEELHRLADLIGRPRNLAPRYNIAPTSAPCGNSRPKADVPNSIQDETLHHSRLGLLRVDRQSGGKTPHYFSARCGEPLAFAASWGQAKHPDTGEPLTSATIIVGAANNG